MSKEHMEDLRRLRDQLVEDRRNLVTTMLADPHSTSETAHDFMNLQQFVDMVERALGHEQSLERPAPNWPPRQPKVNGRP